MVPGRAAVTPAEESKPSVRIPTDEAWAVVSEARTGVLCTLRRDGVPIMLPVYHFVIDRRIYVRTGADSKKAIRVRRDPRASFLVEAGERWSELRAVHMTGTVEVVAPDDPRVEDLSSAFDAKYAATRARPEEMRESTRAYYARPRTYLRFQPDDRILTWDNRRIAQG
jgi:PPOX class probable F420-dependent enzyme